MVTILLEMIQETGIEAENGATMITAMGDFEGASMVAGSRVTVGSMVAAVGSEMADSTAVDSVGVTMMVSDESNQ